MKNFIYNNYGIVIEKLYKSKEYYFFYNNRRYTIIELNNEEKIILDKIIKTKHLYTKMNACKFITNKHDKYITTYNDKKYVLVCYEKIWSEKITIDDILKFEFEIKKNLQIKELDKKNILNEFKSRVDFLENKIIEYKNEYKNIMESINYYIGCAENAIGIIKKIENIVENNSVGIECEIADYKLDKYTNPINYFFTNKAYNYAKYIKHNFFYEMVDYDELNIIINDLIFEEKIYLFSLLMYPDYYFEIVEKILKNQIKEETIIRIIEKVNDYEQFLCEFEKKHLKSEYQNYINWINNVV